MTASGGRVHVVGTAQRTCNITQVILNNILVYSALSWPSWSVDWLLVHPLNAVAGQPTWLAWHSNLTLYDTLPTLPLVVLCSSGDVVLNATVAIRPADVVMSYVTTNSNFSNLLVHLSNNISETRSIASVLVNGVDVTSYVAPASQSIPPFPATVLLQLPLTPPVGVHCVIQS